MSEGRIQDHGRPRRSALREPRGIGYEAVGVGPLTVETKLAYHALIGATYVCMQPLVGETPLLEQGLIEVGRGVLR